MQFRTARRLVLISCLSLSASGCSVLLVNGPPSNHATLDNFACTESKAVPGIDATFAGLGGVLLVASGAQDPNSGSEEVTKAAGVAIGLVSLLGGGISAMVGFNKVDRCRTARSELARRSQEAAARARLMTQAGPASVGSTVIRRP